MPGMVVHTCNPSTHKFKASLGYIASLRSACTTRRPCVKKEMSRKTSRGYWRSSVVKLQQGPSIPSTKKKDSKQKSYLCSILINEYDFETSLNIHFII
jgi:hypothetical protein